MGNAKYIIMQTINRLSSDENNYRNTWKMSNLSCFVSAYSVDQHNKEVFIIFNTNNMINVTMAMMTWQWKQVNGFGMAVRGMALAILKMDVQDTGGISKLSLKYIIAVPNNAKFHDAIIKWVISS